MCGIAGIAYEGGASVAVAASVRRMIALQEHRGPDGQGFYDAPGVSLGHARLAIIDLSDTGHQPMADPTGRYWITYNGEIYNYLELAEELKGLGHRFQGNSDTEVLLTAYREWGEDCLKRLRGMFAFAIWDTLRRSLFAVRDRLGIKPFHYWVDGGRSFAFSSEIKALLELLPSSRVHERLAGEYLAWNLLEHVAAETMLEGVKRLPAAHALTWRPGEGIKLRQYWTLQVSEELSTPVSERASLEAEFRRRFEESVRIHLRADVPVGSCLSGGLDSSAIVCIINSELRRKGVWRDDWQYTFSACFDDPAIDERPYIKEVIAATNCHSHFVFPTGERLRDEMDTWLWHQEEPVGGTGTYAHYCVARLAKEHRVKVLLDGQGADEQLAGYRKFVLTYIWQLAAAGRYGQAAWEAFSFFSSPAILRTSQFTHGRRYFSKSLSEVDEIWPRETQPVRPSTLGIRTTLGRRLESDVLQFSLPVLLRYEDRNTMAFGIESRVPYLDHDFVEWLATLPADMRLSNGWTKKILRDALAGVLPEKIRTRKTKLGFSTPFDQWMNGPLAGWVREMLEEALYLPDVVEMRGVRRLLERFIKGDRSSALVNMLFRCAVYEAWARQFLNSSAGIRARGKKELAVVSGSVT